MLVKTLTLPKETRYFTPMIETIVVLLLSVFFFISGKVRSDVVALCALVALMVMGILEPAEALSGFSNNVIIMMIGLFVVGGTRHKKPT